MDGIDRGEPACRRRQRRRPGRSQTTTTPPPQRCHEPDSQPLESLLEKGAQIAAMLLETVQEVDGDYGFARQQRSQECIERFLVDQTEHVSHPIGAQARRVGRQELIQHGFGISHAAGSQSGDQINGLRVSRSTLGVEDHLELAGDLDDGQSPKVETLQARQDCRRETGRFGRGKHEVHEFRGFFEGLEQRAPGILGDLMGLIENEDLMGELAGRVLDEVADFADGIDSPMRGGIDLKQVERPSLTNSQARRTCVAGLAVVEVGAVDCLGQDAGKRGLTGATRPGEEDAVGGPA